MKTEKQYKKRAAIIFLVDTILVLASVLIFILAVQEPLMAAVTAGEGVDIEGFLNTALYGTIAIVVLDIFCFFLGLAWLITFIKLWKYYGPRFWRCFWVILWFIGFIYYIVGIVLLFGFGINILSF